MKQVKVKIIDTATSNILDLEFPELVVPGGLGTVEEFAKRSSVVLSYDGADDKYQSLMASQLTFDLLDRNGEDGKFFHLYTGSETQYRVDLVEVVNPLLERLIWSGFLLPDQYNEPYKSVAIFVSMTATDGLGLLKGKEIEESKLGKFSVIQYICACLKETGLNQGLYFAPAIEAANGYKWHEIYLDSVIYRTTDKDDLDYVSKIEYDSAYDILERLVHDLGCKLYSYRGKWYLTGVNAQHNGLGSYYEYDSSGNYIGLRNVILPELKKLVFYANPNVAVVSPWKVVEVSADLDQNNDLIDEINYTIAIDFFGNNASDQWVRVGDATVSRVPRGGKWMYTWTNPGQTIPDVESIGPWSVGASGYKPESAISGNYIQLKDPIWIQKLEKKLFEKDKYLSIEIELVAYSTLSTKEKFDNNEYGDVMRYELVFDNEVIYSNFPSSSKYKASSFEVRYSENSVVFKDQIYHNKNFVETRKSITGKIKIDSYSISKSGYLQIRIYPPALLNTVLPVFDTVGIDKLKIKLHDRKSYKSSKVRTIDYTTKKEVDLFHVDNAQDNSDKKFLFVRDGVPEQKAWRQAWKRVGVNESVRYCDAYAMMIHDVQPKPHIKIDGTAIGILSPVELYGFNWRGDKKFIPTRLTLDFGEGRTELTMIENVYENVNDYQGSILG